jgi:glyoxylase-like metal-dependent hydrolase (beta-lactamase superfamily II)
VLPFIGSSDPWASGAKTDVAWCVLGPNPSIMTLDGTNSWILHGAGASTCAVIDPGPAHPSHRAAILAAAETLDARIEAVLLTHGHPDHAELARDLAQELDVGVRALDPQHRLGDEGLPHGSVMELAGLEIHVVGTPGHTSDSICFAVQSDGILLTGDTVLGRGTTLVAWPDGRLSDYLSSLSRLQDLVGELGITQLLPGHGPMLSHPGAVLDAYLSHRHARLDEVRRAVDEGHVEPAAVVAVVYADVPRAAWPAAEWSVRAQLAYLAQQGELPG